MNCFVGAAWDELALSRALQNYMGFVFKYHVGDRNRILIKMSIRILYGVDL